MCKRGRKKEIDQPGKKTMENRGEKNFCMTNNDSILLLDRKLGICQREIGRVNKLIDYCVPRFYQNL